MAWLSDRRLAWPVLLVVPPVIVLSAAALYSLREDQAAIEREARRSAGVLAADLAPRIAARVGVDLGERVAAACSATASGVIETGKTDNERDSWKAPLCGLIIDGQVRVPRDHPPPAPPDWPSRLTASEAEAWQRLGRASRSDPAALRSLAARLASAPPPVRLNAEWHVARAEASSDPSPASVARLVDLARRATGVAAESGVPLSDLAWLQALRQTLPGQLPPALLEELRDHIVRAPSLLTAALIDQAERVAPGDATVAALRARATANDLALSLLRRLMFDEQQSFEEQQSFDAQQPAGKLQHGAIPVHTDQGEWVAFVHPLPGPDVSAGSPSRAFQVTLVPVSLLDDVLERAVFEEDDLPGYAALGLGLGGRTWRAGNPQPDSTPPVELGSAAARVVLPLVVPSDTVGSFAGELLRVAPEAIAVRQEGPGGVVRLAGVPGGHPLALSVTLRDADVLYASYRLRLRMAIGLILTATLAAFAGLASAWRSFERQRRLGEMKSNFVASVSHELRAPIAAIRLMSENLERGAVEPGERQREYLRILGQECRRLSSLIENVLDFARIERGDRSYAFEPANLAPLVRQTAEVMQAYASERRVSVVVRPPTPSAEMARARVDREALQQALVNLVDNAVKHAPPGSEVTIGIEVERGSDVRRASPRVASVFVDDRGPGIPEDEQARIFEPFYRRGSEMRRETRGIGIGLSIVRHIAEAHGGRVVVRSSEGDGSRFAIELPLLPEAEP